MCSKQDWEESENITARKKWRDYLLQRPYFRRIQGLEGWRDLPNVIVGKRHIELENSRETEATLKLG